jgi:hypothetical protein
LLVSGIVLGQLYPKFVVLLVHHPNLLVFV